MDPNASASVAVLDRLLEPIGKCFTDDVARHIANLRADPVAQDRIEVLADKSTEGTLTTEERTEYETYVSAGQFIAVLQAKARATLARATPRSA